MAVSTCAVLWCILMMSTIAAGSLSLNINPMIIYPTLTTSLEINCTFTYDGLANFSSIISLIVSRADGESIDQPTSNFAEMLSLNAFASDHVTDFQHHQANVSGHIGAGDVAYVTAYWANPSADDGGLYKCEAVGVDVIGHSVQASTIISVTAHRHLDQLLAKLSDLQTAQSQLQAQLANHSATITAIARLLASPNATSAAFQSEIGLVLNTTDITAALQADLDQHKRQQAALFAAMFETSGEYNGRQYLLSKFDNSLTNLSQAYCEYMGGYLAEIDNAAEHQFIKAFVDNYKFAGIYIIVAGTDQAVEGQWVFERTGLPLSYTDWDRDQPDDSYDDYDCIYLYKQSDWKMGARYCDNPYPFLCEVPTQ